MDAPMSLPDSKPVNPAASAAAEVSGQLLLPDALISITPLYSKRLAALPKSEGVSRSVIVVTDGYVTVENEVFQLIRRNLGNSNVFAFGIGSSARWAMPASSSLQNAEVPAGTIPMQSRAQTGTGVRKRAASNRQMKGMILGMFDSQTLPSL
mgnify:CR=1 FL=1